jgi:hypothetical protein
MRFYDPDKPLFDRTWKRRTWSRFPTYDARIGRRSRAMTGTILRINVPALAVALCFIAPVDVSRAQSPSANLPVTADNFTRAESETYFANIVKQAGGLGRFLHRREIEPVDRQIVIRANRDTLYSAAVFDLDAGPVTIALPDAGKRFMSLIVIDEDQYTLPQSRRNEIATNWVKRP